MYIKLSYNLSRTTPVVVGGMPVKIKQISDMKKDDISNVFIIEATNHTGTHIDAPRHFSINGKKISEIDIENFFFGSPICIDIPKKESELIMSADLEPYTPEIIKSDILLIRTGFSRYRSIDKGNYCSKNPGFSAEAAHYLMKNFSKLRAIGIDTISFAANEHLKEGIEAHKILFNNAKRFLLLIEDLNLEPWCKNIKQVIAIPLFIEEFDSSLCTVIAKVE